MESGSDNKICHLTKHLFAFLIAATLLPDYPIKTKAYSFTILSHCVFRSKTEHTSFQGCLKLNWHADKTLQCLSWGLWISQRIQVVI